MNRILKERGGPAPPQLRRGRRRRRGMAMVMALAILTMLMALAVALVTSTATALKQSDNLVKIESARRQAESGLSYCTYVLRDIPVPVGSQGSDLVLAIATGLRQRLDGTANLNGGTIIHDPNGPDDPNDLNPLNDPNTITIPSIVTGDGTSFNAVLSLSDDANGVIELSVTGWSGLVARTIGVEFQLDATEGGGFFGDYGIASKGKVTMTGNARVRGANDPSEANVLAATFSDDEAVSLTGNCRIDGDLSISNPDGYASLTGNVSVGGATGTDIDEHIHSGTGEVEFPEVDPTVFEPFATNLVDASTSTSGNKTFTNIRIAAGTNKTFSGNIKLNGVIFIEVPNNIHFSGNVRITGVIVTQDAGAGGHSANSVKFTGNTTVRGVEELDGDDPQFDGLRDMPGAFILAPGFSTQFTGNFGTVSGCMAADEFKFTGNAGGTIKGGIINYGDTEFKLTGNSNLTIDRSGTPPVPPGFHTAGTATLTLRSGTYREY